MQTGAADKNMRQWFLSSELPLIAPDRALFHVIPVPYEASVSYGHGTRNGPQAILEASDQLELWDGASIPADLGIYTAPAVDCSGSAETVMARISAAVRQTLDVGGIPVVLGGEHTVTYGALAALAGRHAPFGIVQFDAHADLRESYEGTRWSHACVMRRATEDLGLSLVQIGVRAMCVEEVEARRRLGVVAHDAARLFEEGEPEVLLPDNFPQDIYVTFDVDGLDAGVMPATGTPVPGGLGWHAALRLARRCMTGRRVIGLDVVELAPMTGFHAADFTAAQLVYSLMGLVQRHSRL